MCCVESGKTKTTRIVEVVYERSCGLLGCRGTTCVVPRLQSLLLFAAALSLQGLVGAGPAFRGALLLIASRAFGEVGATFDRRAPTFPDGSIGAERGEVRELAHQRSFLKLQHSGGEGGALSAKDVRHVLTHVWPHFAVTRDVLQQVEDLIEDVGRTRAADRENGRQLVERSVFAIDAQVALLLLRDFAFPESQFDASFSLLLKREILNDQRWPHAEHSFDRAVAVEDVGPGAIGPEGHERFVTIGGDDPLVGVHAGPELLLGLNAFRKTRVDVEQQGRVRTFGLREQLEVLFLRTLAILDDGPADQTIFVVRSAEVRVHEDVVVPDEQGGLAADARMIEVELNAFFNPCRTVHLEAGGGFAGLSLKDGSHLGSDDDCRRSADL
jgi:hypothetical protein